jgi:putative flippase GtrA
MLERSRTAAKRIFSQSFLRFLLVGVVNTFIDALVFNAVLLFAVFGSFETELVAAKSLGFIAATVNSYYLNARWTFKTAGPLTKRNYLRFLCVSIFGLLLNVLAAYLVYYIGNMLIPLHPFAIANIALVGATVASLLWNYLGYKKFVFSL